MNRDRRIQVDGNSHRRRQHICSSWQGSVLLSARRWWVHGYVVSYVNVNMSVSVIYCAVVDCGLDCDGSCLVRDSDVTYQSEMQQGDWLVGVFVFPCVLPLFP